MTAPYTPYSLPNHPLGAVLDLPWQGAASVQPDGAEDCHGLNSDSTKRADVSGTYVVTCGAMAGGAIVPTVAGSAFRMLALGHTAGLGPVRWTDGYTSYRFRYSGPDVLGVNPGFKLFARYETEDDLFVASWRLDGTACIQLKSGGKYSTIAQAPMQSPAPGAWNRIGFDVQGADLVLVLNGARAAIASGVFPAPYAGTFGIRTDGVLGAEITDWCVQP